MERVQSVRIKLSNGVAGIFFGYPIAEPGDDVQAVSVEFEAPRFVSGISFVENGKDEPVVDTD